MEENSTKLKLIYKNEAKEMNFFPKTFSQLRDYFLSIFNQKSSEEFIFKSYPSQNKNLIIEEEPKFKLIRKIKILKNPAIFIIDKDEEDYMEQIDKDNLKYIENNNLGFELQNIYKDYDINKIKEELERKSKVFEELQKKIDFITKGIEKVKNNNRNV